MPASPRSPRCSTTGCWPRGHDALLTFEPGDTHVGRDIRRIVLSPETGHLTDRTEALLYAADKAEHVEKVVLPALARGTVVITDRYVDTALAYQGAGRGLDGAALERVLRWATGDLRPHLTVLLDVEPAPGSAGSRSATGSRRSRSSSTSVCAPASSPSPRPTPTTTSSSTPAARRGAHRRVHELAAMLEAAMTAPAEP